MACLKFNASTPRGHEQGCLLNIDQQGEKETHRRVGPGQHRRVSGKTTTLGGPRFVLKLALSALRVKIEESKLPYEDEIRSVEGR